MRTAQGGQVDRDQRIEFTFDGRRYEGLAGDTLASALLANGVHLIARSFKYHRPRGVIAAGSEEPNALVRVVRDAGRDAPNMRATQIELYDGLSAFSQNCWPSPQQDIGAGIGIFAPLIPAGFYYKTFMGPHWLGVTRTWSKLFEPLIRRTAGLGRAPVEPDPDTYLNRYAHCEVLVIGAGPAGIAAAHSAVAAGAQVIICDEQAHLGGTLLADSAVEIDDLPAQEWVHCRIAELKAAGATVLPRTTAFGYYAANFVSLVERLTDHLSDCTVGASRERLWQVRADTVIIATGAIERPLVFSNNDRPGIMLADAARTYLNRYAVKVGEQAVIVTGCDSAYRAALDLHAAGVDIAAVCDLRDAPPVDVVKAAEAQGITVLPATTVTDTRGRRRVAAVKIASISSGSRIDTIACDTVLMCGGWTPSISLYSQSRGTLVWDEQRAAFLPGHERPGQRVIGACGGLQQLQEILNEGYAAGASAASHRVAQRTLLRVTNEWSYRGDVLATGVGAPQKMKNAFVDFQNDVTTQDIALAVREGFRSIEHVKRYTTTGMATDQGRTSNLNALVIVAAITGRKIPEIGTTSFRAPYTPVSFGALAGNGRGQLLDPLRRPPSDEWTRLRNVVYENVGLWRRAQYFPQQGEDRRAAINRECHAVRRSVGLLDASTLGKIEVVGPDAREFLARMYVNALNDLDIGRCRYAILLNEAGYIIDDGVIACLAEDRFHVTTTTGGAARVLSSMEDYLQTEWPELQVWLTSITDQWAAIALQGPRARELLTSVYPTIDWSDAALPHMSVREIILDSTSARIFRVSFTGELGFEINIPTGVAPALWASLCQAAEHIGGCAYGTDAMHVLRAEKGYIIVGQDTDGTNVPDDVGLSWAIGKHKSDFVGKRSLERSDIVREDRRQLVGLLTDDPECVLVEGAQVTANDSNVGTRALGYVTSAYYSATLGRSIALALVEAGRRRQADHLCVPLLDRESTVEVVSPLFYDPNGERLNG